MRVEELDEVSGSVVFTRCDDNCRSVEWRPRLTLTWFPVSIVDDPDQNRIVADLLELRFHELRGKRHAILRKSDDKESCSSESSAWLRKGNPDSAQIAFMIGFFEKNTAQIEGYMAETEQSRREGEVAKRRIAALTEESGRLTIQHDQLQQELARLDRLRGVRGSGSSKPSGTEVAYNEASQPVSTGGNL